jgi:hypothetical protein
VDGQTVLPAGAEAEQLLQRSRQQTEIVAARTEQAMKVAQDAVITAKQGIELLGDRSELLHGQMLDVAPAECLELCPQDADLVHLALQGERLVVAPEAVSGENPRDQLQSLFHRARCGLG